MRSDETAPSIRQERIEMAGRAQLRLGSESYQVLNVSSFGLAFTSKASFEQGDEFRDATLRIGVVEFISPTLRVVRCTPQGDEHLVGVETVDSYFDADGIRGYCNGCDVVDALASLERRGAALPAAFRALVLSIKAELASAKEKINLLEKKSITATELESERISFETSFTSAVAARFSELLEPVCLELADILGSLSSDAKDVALGYFREHLEPYIYGSVFSRRSYEKPSGYAGDHRMMSILYRDDLVGASLYDKCIHRYFLSTNNVQAVRNRRRYLHKKIFAAVDAKRDGITRILSVASGPAQEIVDLIASADVALFEKIEFTLLDQDQKSLVFAQKSIVEASRARGISPVVHYVNMNVRRVTRDGMLGSFDLVYSAGLFDYFDDEVARKVAQGLFNHVAENGSMVLGNFRADVANQALMELALDWFLIYRSSEHLEQLYGGIAPRLHIEAEPMYINLFAVLSR